MAGNAGNWYKPAKGRHKGTVVYLDATQTAGLSRGQVLDLLEANSPLILPAVNANRPAAAIRPSNAAPAGPRGAATTVAFGRDPNTRYELRHRVVDLDTLIPSNTDKGGINPAYDPALQPRDRSRVASQEQIATTAQNLNPEAMLLDFHQISLGSPIAGGDMQVESGNGRILALRRARADFPQKWQEYQAALRDNLAQAGLSVDDLKGIKNPVLIRERVTPVDRAKFGQEANESAPLRMSPLEVAQGDARRLSDALVSRLSVREDEPIDQALRAASNRQFVRDFLNTIPASERAALVRGDGSLSQAGLWRAKAAVYARTLPGEAGKRLSETFLESLDSNIKNFESGLTSALPRLVKAQSLMSSGARHKELDIMEDTSKAIDMLARLREQSMPVNVYLDQSSIFARELTPRQERLLGYFDRIGKQPKAVREFLNRYADEVERSPDPDQGSLFGPSAPPSVDEMLDRILT